MLKIYQRYAPNALAPTTAYPLGSIKNDSTPGADDGTPLEKDWGNNVEGFHQALMTSAGLTANGTPDTAVASQLLDALKIVAADIVKVQMRDIVYRVGSYYINDFNPVNPATLLGFGTWVRVEGRSLFGCDGSGVGAFGSGGSEGGSLSHGHTVTGTSLSVDQIPLHGHTVSMVTSGIGDADGGDGRILTSNNEVWGNVNPATYITANATGGGLPHSHGLTNTATLPPYRVVYIWRRTA